MSQTRHQVSWHCYRQAQRYWVITLRSSISLKESNSAVQDCLYPTITHSAVLVLLITWRTYPRFVMKETSTKVVKSLHFLCLWSHHTQHSWPPSYYHSCRVKCLQNLLWQQVYIERGNFCQPAFQFILQTLNWAQAMPLLAGHWLSNSLSSHITISETLLSTRRKTFTVQSHILNPTIKRLKLKNTVAVKTQFSCW